MSPEPRSPPPGSYSFVFDLEDLKTNAKGPLPYANIGLYSGKPFHYTRIEGVACPHGTVIAPVRSRADVPTLMGPDGELTQRGRQYQKDTGAKLPRVALHNAKTARLAPTAGD